MAKILNVMPDKIYIVCKNLCKLINLYANKKRFCPLQNKHFTFKKTLFRTEKEWVNGFAETHVMVIGENSSGLYRNKLYNLFSLLYFLLIWLNIFSIQLCLARWLLFIWFAFEYSMRSGWRWYDFISVHILAGRWGSQRHLAFGDFRYSCIYLTQKIDIMPLKTDYDKLGLRVNSCRKPHLLRILR